MADKTDAFEGGDDIDDRGSHRQSTLSNDDSGESSTAVADSPALEVVVPIPSTPAVKDAPELPSEPDVPKPSTDTRLRVTHDSFPSPTVLALVSPKKRTSFDDFRVPTDKHIQQYLCNTDSSSKSDSCAKSHSGSNVGSVPNSKQSKNDSTCLSINTSSETESPRRDPLAVEPMQSLLTPASRPVVIRVSKFSPRKRLQSTKLDRLKSTSPGPSYSKLSRSSSVGNVPPKSDAWSLNRRTVFGKISGSPRYESVSLPSLLALPSSSRGSSTAERSLSSETQSTCCDPNPLTPVAHFTTSNNPRLRGYSQHALPAHLHQTRKTTSPFGSRILNPPVQPSCQLPRLRVFPEHSPILNVPCHNDVLKNTGIRLSQATSQISKQLSDKTEEPHARREIGLILKDCYKMKLEHIIKERLSNSTRVSPVPSETLQDSLASSETLRDSPSSSKAPLGGPGTSQVLHDSAPEMPISSTLARSSRLHHQQSSDTAALELLATTAATHQRLQSSSIHELSFPSISHGTAEGISPLLPSTSNSGDGANVPFIPVGSGEASISSCQPSRSTFSGCQPFLLDLLQSTPLSERVDGVVAYLPLSKWSPFAEEAKRLLHEVCWDIVMDMGDARWLECDRPLRRTSSPSASSETERNFPEMSKLQTENKAAPFLGMTASTRLCIIAKQSNAAALRESIASLSFNALSAMLFPQSHDLDVMLKYCNECSLWSQAFTSLKADTLHVMDSADHSFRQEMSTLLDQISSYLARLKLALENVSQYVCERRKHQLNKQI